MSEAPVEQVIESPPISPTEVSAPLPTLESPETTTESQIADLELQALFKVVIGKIRLSVASHQLTTDSFTAILLKVVESIEELSSLKNVSGTEKRAIAINLTRLVIDDLYKHGQINEDVYKMLTIGVGFLAPLLFKVAKDSWNKLQEIHEDISENGTKGCFGRNCRK